LGVKTIDNVIWENMPSKPIKVGVNRQFHAQMPKFKNCTISKTVNSNKPKFEDKA